MKCAGLDPRRVSRSMGHGRDRPRCRRCDHRRLLAGAAVRTVAGGLSPFASEMPGGLEPSGAGLRRSDRGVMVRSCGVGLLRDRAELVRCVASLPPGARIVVWQADRDVMLVAAKLS